MKGNEVRAEEVVLRYGERLALNRVSLQAGAGQMVGLIGPNGSGKSSLLRTISGVVKPQEGIIWLGERNVHRLSRTEVARCLAVVP